MNLPESRPTCRHGTRVLSSKIDSPPNLQQHKDNDSIFHTIPSLLFSSAQSSQVVSSPFRERCCVLFVPWISVSAVQIGLVSIKLKTTAVNDRSFFNVHQISIDRK